MSKTWKEKMMAVTRQKNVVGEISGRVIALNSWNAFAPSIRAAS